MKKILQRLLVFAVGLPLVTGIILFLPQFNHLALNIVVIVFSALGALEFAAILESKGMSVHPAEAVILGALAPAVMTVQSSLGKNLAFSAVFILGALWLLVSRIFSPEEKLKGYTEKAAAGFSLMLYPGLFMACIVQMSGFPQAGMVILAFLLIVFANDSAAWAAGMLFGKGNRGLIPASPNKSIAGFIGGIGASILIGAGAEVFIGSVFVSRLLPAPLGGIAIGLCTGIAANLGDLAESAMKRSSGIKDSGRLIPGRGGVLDCIDSVSLAAPVFYILYRAIF
ncbi:MAG: phosphatidate cytidylyltransferase [Treponema sp.]|jgi:phosphatidate cytidylyltransferase|nr:phosphatidate cytidylyltransferase [Treponema sp.]